MINNFIIFQQKNVDFFFSSGIFEILGRFFTLSYRILLNTNQKHYFSYQVTPIGSLEGLETICNGFYTLGWISPKYPPATFFCTYALLGNNFAMESINLVNPSSSQKRKEIALFWALKALWGCVVFHMSATHFRRSSFVSLLFSFILIAGEVH